MGKQHLFERIRVQLKTTAEQIFSKKRTQKRTQGHFLLLPCYGGQVLFNKTRTQERTQGHVLLPYCGEQILQSTGKMMT